MDFQKYLDETLSKVNIETYSFSTQKVEYDIYVEIANEIINLRNDFDITQGELAKLSGVSQANISKFENGNSCPNISTLKKIADGVGRRLVIKFVENEGDI